MASVNSSFFRTNLVAFLLAFSFLTFQYFPYFGNVTREIWLALLIPFFVLYVLFIQRNYSHAYYKQFKLYVIFVLLLGVYTSLSAFIYYDQPLLFGLLSQRSLITSVSGLLLIELFRRNVVTLRNIRDGFLYLAWLTFFINCLLFLFVRPEQFSDVAGFAGGSDFYKYYFHYQLEFTVFLFFYAFLKVLYQNRIGYSLVCLATLVFIVVVAQKRAAFFALLFAVSIYLLRKMDISRLIVVGQVALVFLVVLVGGTYFYNQDLLLGIYDRFADAVTVVTSGQLTSDDSANTRILQLEIAKEYIERNLFFGNGRISVAWKDGYQTFISYRFFPTDMGVFGATYVFGLFGLIFLLLQFYFPFAAVKLGKIGRAGKTPASSEVVLFVDAIVLMVFYHFAFGFMHGTFFFQPYKVLMLAAILYISSIQLNRSGRNTHSGLS